MGEAKRKQQLGQVLRIPRNRCKCGWKLPSAFGLTPVTDEGKTDTTFVFTPELTEQLARLAIQYQCPSCGAVFGVKLQAQEEKNGAASPEPPPPAVGLNEDEPKEEDHGPA